MVKYMKNYKYLLFDVDGTIIESGPGVENSYQYALDTLGYNVKATRKTYNSIKITFSSVSGADKYAIYRSTSKNGTYNIRGYYYNFAFSIDKKISGYFSSGSIKLYLYDDTGVISDLGVFVSSLKNYCNWSVESGGINQYGDYKYQYDGKTFEWISLKSDLVNNIDAKLSWDTDKIEDSGFINTNIKLQIR